MHVEILTGVGLVVLLILCLPFATVQKLVLELSALVLRLALLALVAAGAFLLVYPDRLPAEVPEAMNNFPALSRLLPEPGTAPFGACLVGLVVVALLPVLAVLDVTRKLAGRRLYRLRALSAAKAAEAPAPPPVVQTVVAPPPPPAEKEVIAPPRRTDRQTAADTLASAGSRKPFRYTGPERARDLPPGTR